MKKNLNLPAKNSLVVKAKNNISPKNNKISNNKQKLKLVVDNKVENLNTGVEEIKKRAARKSRKSKFKSANSNLFFSFLYCGCSEKPELKNEVKPESLALALMNINSQVILKPNQGRPSRVKEEIIDVENIEKTEFLLINSSGDGEEQINSRFKPSKNSISDLVIRNDLKNLKKKINKQNVNQREDKNFISSFTPLYWAVKYKRLEAAKILLDLGADVQIVINDLEECCGTALDLACLREDTQMEQLLRGYVPIDKKEKNTSYRAIRSKLRGKGTPGFSFRYVAKNKHAAK